MTTNQPTTTRVREGEWVKLENELAAVREDNARLLAVIYEMEKDATELQSKLAEANERRDYWHDQFVTEKRMRKDSDERAEAAEAQVAALRAEVESLRSSGQWSLVHGPNGEIVFSRGDERLHIWEDGQVEAMRFDGTTIVERYAVGTIAALGIETKEA